MKKRETVNEMIVSVVLDKSGSMQSVRDATTSGFNEYIQTLEKDSKMKYRLFLTLFDTKVSKKHIDIPIEDTEELDRDNYEPDGMTALYDAVMMTIKEIEKKAKDRHVLFVIITDGQENSSREYTQKDLAKKVDELKEKNWKFVFLGANQDAWLTAQQFNIERSSSATFVASSVGTRSMFKNVAESNVNYAAQAVRGGFEPQAVSFFKDSQLEEMEKTG